MELKKEKDTFDEYSLRGLTWQHVIAMRDALAENHASPHADELFANLVWNLDRVPGPGEEDEDGEKEKEGEHPEDRDGLFSEETIDEPLEPGERKTRPSSAISDLDLDLDLELPAPPSD